MQVVQPYPTRWNPSACRYGVSPARSRYRVTTFDPGAGLVFSHGRVLRPFSTAFFATSPAPLITEGLEGFVQLVVAAIPTEPSCRSYTPLSSRTDVVPGFHAPVPGVRISSVVLPPSPIHRSAPSSPFSIRASSPHAEPALRNASLASFSGTRSCGRRGPAMHGSTVERSSERV